MVAATWNGLEEIAADKLAPICKALSGHVFSRYGKHLWHLEQDSLDLGLELEHLGRQASASATDIAHAARS